MLIDGKTQRVFFLTKGHEKSLVKNAEHVPTGKDAADVAYHALGAS